MTDTNFHGWKAFVLTIRADALLEVVKAIGIVALFLFFIYAWFDVRARLDIAKANVDVIEKKLELVDRQITASEKIAATNQDHQRVLGKQLKATQDSLDLSIKVFRSRDMIYQEMVIELRELHKRQEALIKALEKKYCSEPAATIPSPKLDELKK